MARQSDLMRIQKDHSLKEIPTEEQLFWAIVAEMKADDPVLTEEEALERMIRGVKQVQTIVWKLRKRLKDPVTGRGAIVSVRLIRAKPKP
jgi:hypothetical protein